MATRQPEQTDIEIGRQIRERRMALGMSQPELAEACGVSFQQLQKYETGRNRLSVSRLLAIARALECSAAELIEPFDNVKGRMSADQALMRTRMIGATDLVSAYGDLPTAVKGPLLRLLQAMSA